MDGWMGPPPRDVATGYTCVFVSLGDDTASSSPLILLLFSVQESPKSPLEGAKKEGGEG